MFKFGLNTFRFGWKGPFFRYWIMSYCSVLVLDPFESGSGPYSNLKWPNLRWVELIFTSGVQRSPWYKSCYYRFNFLYFYWSIVLNNAFPLVDIDLIQCSCISVSLSNVYPVMYESTAKSFSRKVRESPLKKIRRLYTLMVFGYGLMVYHLSLSSLGRTSPPLSNFCARQSLFH